MAQYNFDQKTKVGQWEVSIDTAAMYGFFEHDIEGEGGGLWFDLDTSAPDGSARLNLFDYDGRAVLPKKVAEAIRQLGHIVGPDFE